jgi:PhnB protein
VFGIGGIVAGVGARPMRREFHMKTASSYLIFDGTTEDAFTFYANVLGGELQTLLRFRDMPDDGMQVPDHQLDRIAHASLHLGPDVVLMANDVVGEETGTLTIGTNFYVFLEAESADEAERAFAALSEGGRVEMPLRKTGWAEKYGMCSDRFGVQWMLGFTGDVVSSGG